MTLVFTDQWGPYSGAGDAARHLDAFVDRACGADVGIVWAARGVVNPLRAPKRDQNGVGEVVVFEWTAAPPPPPAPVTGLWPRAARFFRQVVEDAGRNRLATIEADMAEGRMLQAGIAHLIHSHPDDALGVALDIVCIVLSLALIPTGLGALGIIGLVGGTILLGADGTAYAMEMSGDEEGAAKVKEATETLRIVATVMTLPDIAYSGVKVVREMQEIRELRALDLTTAKSAQAMALRTAKAGRAARFEQIAERALLRAQIRSEQLAAAMKLEITPRGAGIASLMLLLREEFGSDKSALRRFCERIRVHCTAVHR